jgi:hypothetical protein
MIKSEPPGAKAYVDERYLGRTPVEFKDSSAFWTKPRLALKKRRYHDKEMVLRKSEIRTGPLIGTILVTVPVFWLFGYPDEMIFELDPVEARADCGGPCP